MTGCDMVARAAAESAAAAAVAAKAGTDDPWGLWSSAPSAKAASAGLTRSAAAGNGGAPIGGQSFLLAALNPSGPRIKNTFVHVEVTDGPGLVKEGPDWARATSLPVSSLLAAIGGRRPHGSVPQNVLPPPDMESSDSDGVTSTPLSRRKMSRKSRGSRARAAVARGAVSPFCLDGESETTDMGDINSIVTLPLVTRGESCDSSRSWKTVTPSFAAGEEANIALDRLRAAAEDVAPTTLPPPLPHPFGPPQHPSVFGQGLQQLPFPAQPHLYQEGMPYPMTWPWMAPQPQMGMGIMPFLPPPMLPTGALPMAWPSHMPFPAPPSYIATPSEWQACQVVADNEETEEVLSPREGGSGESLATTVEVEAEDEVEEGEVVVESKESKENKERAEDESRTESWQTGWAMRDGDQLVTYNTFVTVRSLKESTLKRSISCPAPETMADSNSLDALAAARNIDNVGQPPSIPPPTQHSEAPPPVVAAAAAAAAAVAAATAAGPDGSMLHMPAPPQPLRRFYGTLPSVAEAITEEGVDSPNHMEEGMQEDGEAFVSFRDRDPLPVTEETLTVMLKGLPLHMTRFQLHKLLVEWEWGTTFDVLYVPWDFRSTANLGFAFINFRKPGAALAFTNFTCELVLAVKEGPLRAFAAKYQGYQANVDQFRNSPVMSGRFRPEHKPAAFNLAGGEVPFPRPTKKLKRLKLRKAERNDRAACLEEENTTSSSRSSSTSRPQRAVVTPSPWTRHQEQMWMQSAQSWWFPHQSWC